MLLVLLIVVSSSNTFVEGTVIGCSAQIREQKLQNSTHIVQGFDALYTEYGFYDYSGCKYDHVIGPIEGIYFLSANLVLKSDGGNGRSITPMVRYYFRERGNTKTRWCAGVHTMVNNGGHTRNTLTMSCFARLELHTSLEIIIEKGEGMILLQLSTVSIQFIGTSGMVPALILPLTDITRKVDGMRSMKHDGSFVNSLTVLQEKGKIRIPCSGLFKMSLMLTTNNSNGPQNLTIRIGGKTVFRVNSGDQQKVKSRTFTFLQTLKLVTGQTITIEEHNLELKQQESSTTFSLIKIREIEEDSHTVFLRLNGENEKNREPLIRFERETPTDFLENNSSSFAIEPTDDTLTHYMAIKTNGIYFVSLDLHVDDAADLDLTLTLGITSETDNTDIVEDSGLATSRNSSSESVTLSIRGTIEVPANAYVSLKIHTTKKRNIRVRNTSQLILTRVSIKNLIAIIDTNVKSAQRVATCIKNAITRLKSTPVHGYDLNKYILQNETTLTAPTDGAYFVHFNQTFFPSSNKNHPESVILYITHRRRGRVISTVKHVVYTNNVLLHRVFSRLMVLKKNDQVELWAECNKEILMRFRISFVIMSTLTSSNFYVKNRNFTDKALEIQSNENREYRVQKKGVYLVLFNIFISYSGVSKDQIFTLKIISQSNNRRVTVAEDRKCITPNTMGASGVTSLMSQTFLEIDSPHDALISSVLEHDRSDSDNNNHTKMYKVEEHFSYILLTSPFHEVHGFQMVQSSKKLLTTVSRSVEPDNFQLSATTGGFKLPGTRLFGPFLKVTKQMTVYYQVSATLEKVKGWFWLGFRIPPKLGVLSISSKVQINKDDGPMTLQASGFITVHPGESVFFMINSETDQNIILSHCVWSLMEISIPEGNDYKEFLEHMERISMDRHLSYMSVTQSSVNGDKVRDVLMQPKSQLSTMVQYPKEAHLIPSHRTQIFNNISSLHLENINNNTSSDIFFVQISNPHSNVRTELRIRNTNDKTMETYNLGDQSSNLIIILTSKNDNQEIILDTKHNQSAFTVSTLSKSTSSFSAILSQTVDLKVTRNGFARIDGWKSNKSPFFDTSHGLSVGRGGMYVVPSNGFYFVAVSLVLEKPFQRCFLTITADEKILSKKPLNRQTVFKDVLWLMGDSALQCMVTCDSKRTVSLSQGSTFALSLLDSRPTLRDTCMEDRLVMSAKETSLFAQVQSNYNLSCHHSQYFVADFMWFKDNKPIKRFLGQRTGTFEFTPLKMTDNGQYHCVMTRGKRVVYSNTVELVVIDPRPKVKLSNRTVFVDEGTISDPMVAWIQVRAFNVSSNEKAAVNLTIIEGNYENVFYFDPPIASTISSLYFRRPLDYKRKNEYKLKFTAYNMEYNGRLGVIEEQITIRVVDKNKHMPKFQEHPKVFEINESTPVGSLIYKFSATDLDGDSLAYRVNNFGEMPLYQIRLKTGELYVNKKLDYETSSKNYLIVSVSDGTYSKSTAITVKLLNTNDNKPYFVLEKYSVSITEIRQSESKSREKKSIIDIQAVDKDPGSSIRLKIVSGDKVDLFGIKGTKLYAKRHLQAGQYQLEVMAMDEKGLQSITNAKVEIKVLKNPYHSTPTPRTPLLKIFDKKFYEVSVKETLDAGAIVFQFSVPPQVTFKLREIERVKNPSFKIDESGAVFLSSKLDLDVSEKHYLVVSACAKNNNCQLCHLTINVIEDENSLPRFQVKTKIAALLYTSQRHTRITSLAFRGRVKRGILFKVNTAAGEEVQTYLKIHPKTVQLFLNSSITNTTLNFIQLDIEIFLGDSGDLIDRCKVRVNLIGNIVKHREASLVHSSNKLSDNVLHWKYMIPFVSLILILVILVVVLILLYNKVKRSKKKNEIFKTEIEKRRNLLPIDTQSIDESPFLTYFTQPAESLEDMMNFSCETIPSAYHSLKDVREGIIRADTDNQSNCMKYNNSMMRTFENDNLLQPPRKNVSWACNGDYSRTNGHVKSSEDLT